MKRSQEDVILLKNLLKMMSNEDGADLGYDIRDHDALPFIRVEKVSRFRNWVKAIDVPFSEVAVSFPELNNVLVYLFEYMSSLERLRIFEKCLAKASAFWEAFWANSLSAIFMAMVWAFLWCEE